VAFQLQFSSTFRKAEPDPHAHQTQALRPNQIILKALKSLSEKGNVNNFFPNGEGMFRWKGENGLKKLRKKIGIRFVKAFPSILKKRRN
jgi:hypothetical protein